MAATEESLSGFKETYLQKLVALRATVKWERTMRKRAQQREREAQKKEEAHREVNEAVVQARCARVEAEWRAKLTESGHATIALRKRERELEALVETLRRERDDVVRESHEAIARHKAIARNAQVEANRNAQRVVLELQRKQTENEVLRAKNAVFRASLRGSVASVPNGDGESSDDDDDDDDNDGTRPARKSWKSRNAARRRSTMSSTTTKGDGDSSCDDGYDCDDARDLRPVRPSLKFRPEARRPSTASTTHGDESSNDSTDAGDETRTRLRPRLPTVPAMLLAAASSRRMISRQDTQRGSPSTSEEAKTICHPHPPRSPRDSVFLSHTTSGKRTSIALLDLGATELPFDSTSRFSGQPSIGRAPVSGDKEMISPLSTRISPRDSRRQFSHE